MAFAHLPRGGRDSQKTERPGLTSGPAVAIILATRTNKPIPGPKEDMRDMDLTDQHTIERKQKKRKRKDARIRLSRVAMAAVRHLRSLPPSKAGFSLYVTQEGTPHRMTVIDNGRGRPDSAYFVHQSKSAAMPDGLPPTSTYVVSTDREMDTVLSTFADSPELWCHAKGDALGKEPEPFDEEDWEA